MGDTKIKENEQEKTTDQDSESGSSLKPLRSVKPSQNISILDEPPIPSEEEVQKVHDEVHDELHEEEHEETVSLVNSEAKVETFFEKPLEPSFSENQKLVEETEPKLEADTKPEGPAENAKTLEEPPPNDKPQPIFFEKTRVGSAASDLNQSTRILRNQSDIFSLKEQTSIASAIFSVNGSPSRKIIRRKEMTASNVFPFGQIAKEEPPFEKKMPSPREKIKETKECYNELRRQSGTVRNPLTGTGLSSNDEYRFKGSKRRDGNPLLGLGYSPEVTPSTHRIPPGGFSHKLW